MVSLGWKVGDDVEEVPEVRRERMIWLSDRIMLSHLSSGENWMSRAPDEKVLGTGTLETRRMSSSGLGRS